MCSGALLLSTFLVLSQPPAKPGKIPESKASQETAANVLKYCQEHMGQKVSNGECAELAIAALKFAHARRFGPHGADADYVWGNLIATIKSGETFPEGKIQPGDILQFRDAQFPRSGASHHTSIVHEIHEDGRSVSVLEQNAGPSKDPEERRKVQTGKCPLAEIKEGWVKVYRPVPLAKADLRNFRYADPNALEIARLLNVGRTQAGEKPLKLNVPLGAAAAALARKKATGQKLESDAILEALQEAGYIERTVQAIHAETATTPTGLLKSWADSPGVHKIMMSSQHTEVGVFLVYPRPGQAFCCALFASPADVAVPAKKEKKK
jgi:uncharacterized protein YkwD